MSDDERRAQDAADHRRRVVITGLYIVSLFAAFAAFAVVSFTGGSPYRIGPAKTFDVLGQQTSSFRAGDWLYVRRQVCLEKPIYAELVPSLYDLARRAVVPLPSISYVGAPGCAERSQAVQLPEGLPPGDYEYRSVVRYQNNLVGRDESNVYPNVQIKVVP